MNIVAAGNLVILLLEKGGIKIVPDLRTLLDAYLNIHSKKLSFSEVLTKDNLDAIQRLLNVLATCVQDPNSKKLLQTFINSLEK